MTHKIYLASSWRNGYQSAMVDFLRGQGHTVYDFRHPEEDNDGFHWKEIDPQWNTWDIDRFKDALWSPIAHDAFHLNKRALECCDLVVLLLPSGRSSHIEAAYHAGKGGPVIVHCPTAFEFDPELMYKLFTTITTTEGELMEFLALPLDRLNTLSLAGAKE